MVSKGRGDMVFDTHITLIIGGLLLGGIYSMIAFGLTLTFGVSRVLNIAHGDFLILGSVVGLILFELFGINPFLSIAIVAPLFTVVGMAIDRGLIRTIINRAAERALTAAIIVTVGLSMAIEDSTAYYLGQAGGWAGGLGYISIPYNLPPIGLLGYYLPATRLLSLVAIVVIAFLMWIIITRTYLGKVIRATIQDRETAMCLGADVGLTSAITLGIGIALAAIAGLFYVMITSVSPFAGLGLTVKALTIVILGGLGSLFGSVFSGLIIGLIESYVSYYLGTIWATPVSILILIVILLVRPSGLFGRRVEEVRK